MFISDFKRIAVLVSIFLGTITTGTLGYYFIEGMPLFDSFYMTMITISTVGFGEIHKLSQAGRILTIFIIMSGISIVAYSIGSLLRILLEGELSKSLRRKKLIKDISSLKNHFIICGYGRIGSLIAKELVHHRIPFVVIENDPTQLEQLEKENLLYIIGDATLDEVLIEANISKARGIVTAVKSDADNVFIVLTARNISPDIYILSRGSDEKTEQKLKRAGATKVILPYIIGGKRMAQALIKPNVSDFIDIAMVESELGLAIEEIQVTAGSKLVGKNLIESNLRKEFGVIIVAIKKQRGEMKFNPSPQEILESDDVLVLLGKRNELLQLAKVV